MRAPIAPWRATGPATEGAAEIRHIRITKAARDLIERELWVGDQLHRAFGSKLVEQFGSEAASAIRAQMAQGHQFAVVAAPDARPYVRMVIERLYPSLPVLSHLEIARGVEIKLLGTIS